MDAPTVIRIAQALGLTSSILLAGVNISASLITLPSLYTRPASITTPIFSELYHRGATLLPPFALLSSTCSALAAYLLPAQRSLWAAAALATISQIPWTLLVMKATNVRLLDISRSEREQEKVSAAETEGLLRRWAGMNLARGGLALVGGVVGLWAVMRPEV